MIFLNSYTPLIWTRAGRNAVERHDLPRFVDGSCRREPDFESPFPSISALCRFRKFAPRLHMGDSVVYLTKRRRYPDHPESHWRFVAILNVVHRFESHQEAGEWYVANRHSLPRNCMVEGNPPLPLDYTIGDHDNLEEWDRGYRVRARKCGVFLVCIAEHLDLFDPPIVTENILVDIFGGIPGTRNPGSIEIDELHELRTACGV